MDSLIHISFRYHIGSKKSIAAFFIVPSDRIGGIENKLHRMSDVIFRENYSKKQVQNAML